MKTEKSQEKDMKVEYSNMAHKYALPSYDELDMLFMLGQLDQSEFVLREVVAKLADRCDFVRKLLANLIQPESHLSDMQEAEHLDDLQKQKVMLLFHKLSYYDKEFLIRDIDYNESKDAELIKTFFGEWAVIRKDLVGILTSVRDVWKQSQNSKNSFNSYFG